MYYNNLRSFLTEIMDHLKRITASHYGTYTLQRFLYYYVVQSVQCLDSAVLSTGIHIVRTVRKIGHMYQG